MIFISPVGLTASDANNVQADWVDTATIAFLAALVLPRNTAIARALTATALAVCACLALNFLAVCTFSFDACFARSVQRSFLVSLFVSLARLGSNLKRLMGFFKPATATGATKTQRQYLTQKWYKSTYSNICQAWSLSKTSEPSPRRSNCKIYIIHTYIHIYKIRIIYNIVEKDCTFTICQQPSSVQQRNCEVRLVFRQYYLDRL